MARSDERQGHSSVLPAQHFPSYRHDGTIILAPFHVDMSQTRLCYPTWPASLASLRWMSSLRQYNTQSMRIVNISTRSRLTASLCTTASKCEQCHQHLSIYHASFVLLLDMRPTYVGGHLVHILHLFKIVISVQQCCMVVQFQTVPVLPC